MTNDVVSSDLSYVVSCNFDSVRHMEPYVGELTAVGHSDLSMDLHDGDVTQAFEGRPCHLAAICEGDYVSLRTEYRNEHEHLTIYYTDRNGKGHMLHNSHRIQDSIGTTVDGLSVLTWEDV